MNEELKKQLAICDRCSKDSKDGRTIYWVFFAAWVFSFIIQLVSLRWSALLLMVVITIWGFHNLSRWERALNKIDELQFDEKRGTQ